MLTAIFAGTSQPGSGPGAFCRSTRYRGSTFANNAHGPRLPTWFQRHRAQAKGPLATRHGLPPGFVRRQSAPTHDPPPTKWSDLRYVSEIKEDSNDKEALQARRDRREAAPSGCSSLAGPRHDGGDPADRCERGDLLSLASRVWRAEDRAGQAPEGAWAREQPAAQGSIGSDAGQAHSAGGCPGKLLSPARRRACVEQVRAQLHVSERRACPALGQHRSTQRKLPRGREDEERLTADTIELARQYGRYGYRKVAGLLRQAGWIINDKRVERIWRREGLKG